MTQKIFAVAFCSTGCAENYAKGASNLTMTEIGTLGSWAKCSDFDCDEPDDDMLLYSVNYSD